MLRFKTLKNAKRGAKWIVFLWIVTEIFAIPAAAAGLMHIWDSEGSSYAAFDRVSFAPFPQDTPGLQEFLVTSNVPFIISSEGAVGRFDVSLIQSGNLAEAKFGAQSQMPGPAQACSLTTSDKEQIIYTSNRKTELNEDAPTLERAVLVKIHYNSSAKANFTLKSARALKPLQAAPTCTL